MRLAWCTDIHLNFLDLEARRRFADSVVAATPDALLVTGDITVAPKLELHLEELASRFAEPIYFVLGNHDFWGSSFALVKERMRALSERVKNLRWLGSAGVVRLSEEAVLVGDDGWYDARLGDYERTKIALNDFVRIEDFAYLRHEKLRTKLEALGDESAARLRALLARADARKVIVLTHVPPFREAAWHEGEISGDDWLPFMASRATGEALLEAARAIPGRELLVLCGHTHGAGETRPLPNLTVRTGGAEYGAPELQAPIDI